MIRRSTMADIPMIVELGIEALERNPIPGMLISREKVTAMATECVSQNSNFSWVSEKDGKITGAVSAHVSDMTFYERKQANVVQFYCRQPGEGIALLRAFLKWASERRVIKMIVFAIEVEQDPRIEKVLTRWGFRMAEKIWMRTRYV
jgi:N-acetylglutamate synthase-like GNAT family acetyltransferase